MKRFKKKIVFYFDKFKWFKTVFQTRITWLNVVYEGSYKNGMRNGDGTYKYNDRRVYKGQFKPDDGLRHGVLSKSADGPVIYDGEWLGMDYHGKGILHVDGEVQSGAWEHGKKHGIFMITAHGTTRFDEFVDGVRTLSHDILIALIIRMVPKIK